MFVGQAGVGTHRAATGYNIFSYSNTCQKRGKGVERVVQMLSRLSGSTLFFFGVFFFFLKSVALAGQLEREATGVKGDGAGFRFSFYFSDQSKLTSGICCR